MPSEIIVEFPSPLTEREKKMIYGYKGEVVRCKDCKWWKTNYFWDGHEHKVCVRESHEPLRKAEDFCSHGERREDGV